jgi:HK97 family phage portal protein
MKKSNILSTSSSLLIDIITKPISLFSGRFEKKSADYQQGNLEKLLMPYSMGLSRGIGWLSALGSINYYSAISPIANAIDLVAETASRIYLAVYDKTTKEYVKESLGGNATPQKALKLLESANYTETYYEFMKSVMSYLLITGNAFIIGQSTSENTDIFELFCGKPQDFIINGSGTSLATKYIWQDGNRNLIFNLDKTTFRYIAKDTNGFVYELKHIKNFNPKYNAGNLWGMSVLTQLYLEMEQFISGIVHNNSLLKNGAKPSGVLTLDEEMSNEAYERARAEFQSFYSGAENAGKVLMFEGSNAKFEAFNISPKDMDYPNLVDWVESSLYSRLKIPRALVSDKAMTYNNLNEAKMQLYEFAIFPAFDMILESLTSLIFSRYKDGEKYEIYYDTKDIDAFAEKQMEIDEKIVRLGIATYNEARNKFNLVDLDENGDTVFAPSPMITPLGNAIPQVAEKKQVPLEQFKRILQKQHFSEKEISEAIVRIYGKQQ